MSRKHGVRQALSMLESLRGIHVPVQEVAEVHGISVEVKKVFGEFYVQSKISHLFFCRLTVLTCTIKDVITFCMLKEFCRGPIPPHQQNDIDALIDPQVHECILISG